MLVLTKETQQVILKKYNITLEELKDEFQEFILYWKEKSPNGKKERWEKEKTFDPNLRFHRWLRNSQKWNKKIIVNSGDEERKSKLEELKVKKASLYNNF